MNKLRLALFLGVAFSIGAFSGAWASIWALNEFLLTPNAISSASLGVSSRVAALEAIRAADQEKAKLILETYLDGDLITLSVFPESRLDKPTIEALVSASKYREKHPHVSSETAVTAQVSSLLSRYQKDEGAHP